MKLFNKLTIMLCIAITSFTNSEAQVKNAKIEIVKVSGNCGMCEKTIETAGTIKKVAIVDWDKDTKMATLTYDSSKTDQDEILKRIALAGYDSDKFLAPDEVYNNLHGCCQYDRINKSEISMAEKQENNSVYHQDTTTISKENEKELTRVINDYFTLKDALVKSDGALASSSAKILLLATRDVNMNNLSNEEHIKWMKVLKKIQTSTELISSTTNIENQRKEFMNLSEYFYQLIKVTTHTTPIFYQHCPMYNDGQGANWLSKEIEVKNPYYGSQMLSCGKTVETIK